MGLAVVSVASGGLPVVESTAGGTPVTEATNGHGVPVTKMVGKPGLPVVFETIGVAAPVTYPTWDAATVTAVTLSGGGLVATNTGTTSGDQGARLASASGKTGGKYYFEVTYTSGSSGGNRGFGIATTASTYTAMGTNSTTGSMQFLNSGNIWTNGATTGITNGAFFSGTEARIAVDLDNRRIWFSRGNSSWNNSGTANPATNVGGVTIPAGTMVPIVTFGGSSGTANNIYTANFGASAFVGAVPAGFTSGVARMIELVEIEPGRWRVARETRPVARSNLPLPYVISDEMPETEQVDGRFYTSKAAFRAVGRALGLTEVGNEKPPQTVRSTNRREVKEARRTAIHTAVEKHKAGHRPGGQRA